MWIYPVQMMEQGEAKTLEDLLLEIPNVGEDADFDRARELAYPREPAATTEPPSPAKPAS
jgi:hypothetical protein